MQAAGLQFLPWTTLIVPFLVKRRSGEVLFNILPRYCDVEELWQFFPKNYFHVVFVSNALDHTVHSHTWPKVAAMGTSSRWKAAASSFQADLAAIPDLPVFHSLSVCQLYVVLTSSHRRNVHPERWMSLSDGQHQWGFDVDLGPSGSLTSLDMLRLFDLHWCTTVQDM